MSTNTVDAVVLLNDAVIDDSIIESVDCNRDDVCDDVGDAKQNAEGTSTPDEHDIASCQQAAEEQRSDETLAGCFKLAKAGKGILRLMTINVKKVTSLKLIVRTM